MLGLLKASAICPLLPWSRESGRWTADFIQSINDKKVMTMTTMIIL